MAYVEFSAISKHFGTSVAVADLDLQIEQGEFFSLLGPSGCGKSTTLRMLAGFVKPTTGQIHVNGRNVTALPPEARDIGIVFQNYAIFPHMTVFDNIAFGLVERRLARADIKQKVDAALAEVGMTGFEDRYERELSGGQKQRVALARVLVIEPEILLLDEPLSALDKKMREEMKFWIKNIQKSVGITTIYVTHDQSEALTMSDRIAVMDQGRVLQIGTPVEIYEQPASRFIAEFIGESNLLDGTVSDVDGAVCSIDIGGTAVTGRLTQNNAAVKGQAVALLVRPEMIRLHALDASEQPKLNGTVREIIYQGSVVRYRIQVGDQHLMVEVANRPDLPRLDLDDYVEVYWNADSGVVMP
ncbi:MAG: putative spermidine/putrescine transport system ATP-binding protein [Polaromonas sp.]|jgi:putative spermidine/putrescine transport system ATP-binding protein